MQKWKDRARQLKTDIHALYFAYRDPRTPIVARIVAAVVVGYALSPIDLIPDPIPVLGYLDDLILVPLGIALALRLIPPQVMVDARQRAQESSSDGWVTWIAAGVIVLVWIGLAVLVLHWLGVL